MPYYEYQCLANGRTVEVRHGMDERLETWAELCGRASIDPGDTAAGEPVERVMSVPVALTAAASETAGPSCGPGCACAMDA